jgi:hypothetical protein
MAFLHAGLGHVGATNDRITADNTGSRADRHYPSSLYTFGEGLQVAHPIKIPDTEERKGSAAPKDYRRL